MNATIGQPHIFDVIRADAAKLTAIVEQLATRERQSAEYVRSRIGAWAHESTFSQLQIAEFIRDGKLALG